MIQLIQPNLPGKGTIGDCLIYVRTCYGIGPKYKTAAIAWANAEQHTGNPPNDVKVPLWFKWKVDGHVAINVPGVGLYSSPMKAGENYHIFGSIASVEAFLGATYLGWSPDVNGVKVAAEDIVQPNEAQIRELFTEFAKNPPTQDQINFYAARDLRDLYQDLLTYEVKPTAEEVKQAFTDLTEITPTADQIAYYVNRQKGVLYKDLADFYLKNNPSIGGKPTPLGPGTYEVKE